MSIKKILVFSHEFPPFIGGVGSVGYQISKWLNKRNHQVDVLTRYEDEISYIKNVNFHVVRVLPKFWYLSYKKYINKLNIDAYDVIILNECAPAIVAGKYFTIEQLKKCMVYLHGLEVENIYTNNNRNFLRNLFGFRKSHLRAVNHAKKVVAVGEHMKAKYVKCVGNELIRSVDVIYAGLDTAQFEIINGKDANNSFTLISSSRIVKEKGYFEKLEIFKILADKYDLKWIVCGDGKDLPELRNRVFDSNLESRVEFKGYCNRDELKQHYAVSDVFWLLSNYDEALPLCYIEAQLCGLPTIGRDKGGTRETIKDGITGFLVKNDMDCIKKLSKYIESKDKFDRNEVRKNALYFDIDKVLLELEASL